MAIDILNFVRNCFADQDQPFRPPGYYHFGTKCWQLLLTRKMRGTRTELAGTGNLPGNSRAAEALTFRVGPLVNLPSLVRSLGADPEAVFRQSGFRPDEFKDPDQRMPYLRSSELLADCARATGCEHLGLKLGEMASPSHLGIAGFLLRAAPTVEAGLQAVVENLDLHEEGGVPRLTIEDDYTSFGFTILVPGVKAPEIIYDLAAAMIYKIMRGLCGDDWTATTVNLERHAPCDPLPYRCYFRTTLFFDASECAVTFPSQCLEAKPPAADQLLYRHLAREAKELHALQHHELVEELPTALRQGLLTEQYAARHIAAKFGIHERTLHRRLREAGTSFRRELDQARQSVSEQLLGGTGLPVCDIANVLGYADSSGFIRAFQRWTGTSPSSWRKNNGSTLPGRAN
jgi:AraC-like DNA-binding protein